MPHTSHKKKSQRVKRTEITDEDGWTRVATTNPSQRQPRPLPAQKALEEKNANRVTVYPKLTVSEEKTIERVQEQYQKIEKRWLESESYKGLERFLRNDLDRNILLEIDKCFILGSDTFSGMRHGWIDRSHVAMFQVAALVSAVKIIESISGSCPLVYAQDPIYTSRDTEFLSQLKITTVNTPVAFKTITTRSFIIALGAELSVSLRTMTCNPAVFVQTGKIDMFWRNDKGEACTDAIQFAVHDDEPGDAQGVASGEKGEQEADDGFNPDKFKTYHELNEAQRESTRHGARDEIELGLEICEDFKKDKMVKRLPGLEVRDEPFHDVHVYYRHPSDEEAGVVEDGETIDKL